MATGLSLGVSCVLTDRSLPVTELAVAAEERGFDGLWLPEHTHIPTSRESPYPAGGELPREYSHSLDPFVSLGAAAAVTSTIRLGLGICLVVQRDPITTAKEVATLDVISGGRVEFGIGAGWNREEMANHGTNPKTRMRLMKERVEAMKAIWTEDEASYDGEFVSFERIWSWPKPVQKPHPPILVGGGGPTIADRVLGYADGWLPINAGVEATVAAVKDMRAQAGRHIPVTLNAASTDARKLAAYAEGGIDRVVPYLPQGDRGEVEKRLDQLLDGAREAGLVS